jgi:hypothetical protein
VISPYLKASNSLEDAVRETIAIIGKKNIRVHAVETTPSAHFNEDLAPHKLPTQEFSLEYPYQYL